MTGIEIWKTPLSSLRSFWLGCFIIIAKVSLVFSQILPKFTMKSTPLLELALDVAMGLLVPRERGVVTWSLLTVNWVRLLTGREWQRRWRGRQLMPAPPATETMGGNNPVPTQKRITRSIFKSVEQRKDQHPGTACLLLWAQA